MADYSSNHPPSVSISLAMSSSSSSSSSLLLSSSSEQSKSISTSTSTSSTSISMSFPVKLRCMLDDALEHGLDHIVSWEMNGSAFRVHNPQAFVDKIMGRYFNQTKYKSFQRQLNLYGFSRISRGPNKGCYLHELFHRSNDASSCKGITRKKAEFGGGEDPSVLDLAPTWLPASMVVEPDPIKEEEQQQQRRSLPTLQVPPPTACINHTDTAFDAFESYFQTQVAQTSEPQQETDDLKFLMRKQHQPRTTADPGNALQRMLDSMLEPNTPAQTPDVDYQHQEEEFQMSTALTTETTATTSTKKYQRTAVFPDKLHDMLDFVERHGLTNIASWQMEGRAFRVHDIELFMKHVMLHFFKQTKYESLQRQLNLYGFSRVPKGPLKGCYHHPLFQKGGRALSRGMLRRKPEDIVLVLPKNKTKHHQKNKPTVISSETNHNHEQAHSLFGQLTRAAQQVAETTTMSSLSLPLQHNHHHHHTIMEVEPDRLPSQQQQQHRHNSCSTTPPPTFHNINNNNVSPVDQPPRFTMNSLPFSSNNSNNQAFFPFGYAPAITTPSSLLSHHHL